MGYLYHTVPVAGGVEERCVFPDNTYCEANAFFDGTCTRTPYPPSYYDVYSGRADWIPQARRLCYDSGGSLREVHTPYGDVVMCVFPNGSVCDIRSLLAGMCGDNWLSYAYGWLNAP
jgi:putative hemolysin